MAAIQPQRRSLAEIKAKLLNPATTSHFQVSIGSPSGDGTFNRFLAVFLMFEIALFSSIGLRWGPRGLLDGFWLDFERFWEGFWKVLEGFGKEFGRIWDLMNR